MQAILLEVAPPTPGDRKSFLAETLKTTDGSTEYRHHHRGTEILRDPVERRKSNLLPYIAFDKTGRAHDIEIELPFKYVTETKGDEIEVEEVLSQHEKDRSKIAAYLHKLTQDPSINPAVGRVLADRELKLLPAEPIFEQRLVALSEPHFVGGFVPTTYVIERDLLVKFAMKIAWCFACAELGRDELVARGGGEPLRYIMSGRVSDATVELCRRAAPTAVRELFVELSPEGGSASALWLWRHGIQETSARIGRLIDEAARALEDAHRERVRAAQKFASWVQLIQPGCFERRQGGPTKADRAHFLQLERCEAEGKAAVVATVKLFGTAFMARVALTPFLPAANVPALDLRTREVQASVAAGR